MPRDFRIVEVFFIVMILCDFFGDAAR